MSCPIRRLCTAVGDYILFTLAERWNGVSWDIQPTPNPPGDHLFRGVSCATRAACTAVGGALAERWNGTGWEIQPVPSPADAAFIDLSGVSCTSPDACTVVGSYNTNSAILSLAERWNGTSWQIQSTPKPAGAKNALLSGVSCTSPRTCTAAGFYETSNASFTLIERWNGTNWEIEPSPNVQGASSTTLGGVSCAQQGGCTAVGTYSTSAGAFTLAERDPGQP